MLNVAFLTSSTVAWVMTGNMSAYAFYLIRIANYLYYVLPMLFLAFLSSYILAYLEYKKGGAAKGGRVIKKIIFVICTASILMSTISLFNGMYYYIDEFNVYHRGGFMYWVSQLFPATGVLINVCGVFYYRKIFKPRATVFFLLHLLLPFVAIFVQMGFYGLTFTNMATTLTVLLLYICVQMEYSKEMEEKLTESRISIMLSQIQPHFLYNTLNTIENLCYKDGNKAAKMVNDFSVYLRSNMDSLNQKSLVSFEREIEHTKVYLEIEKQRFEEHLNIVYDFEVTNFKLPVLAIQPLVENAVRHGIAKKYQGGTVVIATRKTADCIKIIISDDGVGFNSDVQVSQNGRSNIGLENVSKRLHAQCGGTLEIKSSEGTGTECCIIIPLKASVRETEKERVRV